MSSYRDEKRYADFFNEGRVLTMEKFLLEKGFNPSQIGNPAKQKEFIEQAPIRLKTSAGSPTAQTLNSKQAIMIIESNLKNPQT